MKFNFWSKESKTDKAPVMDSVALLDLNHHCLRQIGHFLSIEDAYSFGHTCVKLFEIVSQLRTRVTIESSNDLKYLKYFAAGAISLSVYTKLHENEETKLLSIMEKCTKISTLNLLTLNSRILSGEWFNKFGHKLVHLQISLMDRPKIHWPNFIESLRKCENLRSLYVAHDADSFIYSLVELTELFSIGFPKLKVFRFNDVNCIDHDETLLVPLHTFLRHNSQLEVFEIATPLFNVYLQALLLCPKLKKVTLLHKQSVMEENLIARLSVLNKLPMLAYVSLQCPLHNNRKMSPMLRRIKSLRELTLRCTLFEDFIQDSFRTPQITSLKLIISETDLETRPLIPFYLRFLIEYLCPVFFRYGFREIVKRLRYHEQNLGKLTELDLSDISFNHTTTTKVLTEFIKFIVNCPNIRVIKFHRRFPIRWFYKQLLKYEKNFGHNARENTLHLSVDRIPWIPSYSGGRRTHNIIIQNDTGDEPPNISISGIFSNGVKKYDLKFRSILVLLSLFFGSDNICFV